MDLYASTTKYIGALGTRTLDRMHSFVGMSAAVVLTERYHCSTATMYDGSIPKSLESSLASYTLPGSLVTLHLYLYSASVLLLLVDQAISVYNVLFCKPIRRDRRYVNASSHSSWSRERSELINLVKATDENLPTEDWALNLEVCDKVSSDGPTG